MSSRLATGLLRSLWWSDADRAPRPLTEAVSHRDYEDLVVALASAVAAQYVCCDPVARSPTSRPPRAHPLPTHTPLRRAALLAAQCMARVRSATFDPFTTSFAIEALFRAAVEVAASRRGEGRMHVALAGQR